MPRESEQRSEQVGIDVPRDDMPGGHAVPPTSLGGVPARHLRLALIAVISLLLLILPTEILDLGLTSRVSEVSS